jgi:archaellum biogenesis ATPase FlaH
MKAKKLFIIIGNNNSGKTTLQKELIKGLCGLTYKKLEVNLSFDITYSEISKKYNKVSCGSRSYQEKKSSYKSVEEYFEKHFNNQDIAFISSHLVIDDIEKMILEGNKRFYNVYAIFMSNSTKYMTKIGNSFQTLLDC